MLTIHFPLCIKALNIFFQMPPPELDSFGRIISEQPPDEWPARSGIAMAICKMSPHISEDQVETLFEFFVQKALGDRSPEVRKYMLDAAVAVINDHGKVRLGTYGGKIVTQLNLLRKLSIFIFCRPM